MGTAGDAESGGKQNSNSTKIKRVPETTTAATGSSPRVVSALIWAEKLGPDRDAPCGGYCLRSNRRFPEAIGICPLYTGLTIAEDGFRCLKTDLGLRPVRHQTSGRVRAHIFICVLTLHLLASHKKRLAEAGALPRT